MKQTLLILLFLNISFLGFCQKTEQTKAIDNYLTEVMKTYDIPGKLMTFLEWQLKL